MGYLFKFFNIFVENYDDDKNIKLLEISHATPLIQLFLRLDDLFKLKIFFKKLDSTFF